MSKLIKSNTNRFRQLQKVILPYGFIISSAKGHNKIYKDGRMVMRMASSPKDVHNASVFVLQRLKRKGLIPKDVEL